MRARDICVLAALALAATLVSDREVTAGGDEGFVVIVNPQLKLSELDRDFVRDVYLKKISEWDRGGVVHPVDLDTKFPARERFTREVVRKTPAQLRSYWNQQVFSGKGVPPPEVQSVTAVVDYVIANEGAIGYLPANADPGGAHVVRIR